MRERLRLHWGPIFVIVLAIVAVPTWRAIAAGGYQVFGGLTVNGVATLPLKVNADADGVTGHFVVDAGTGFGGGGAPLTGGSTGVATGVNQGVAIHAFNGTTLDALQEVGGALNIRGTGTAGTPGTSVLTIQGVSGGQAVPVSGSLSSTYPYNAAPQGATAATFVGVAGQYNSTLPGLTTGQVAALQSDVAGRLIVAPVGLGDSFDCAAGTSVGVVAGTKPNGASGLNIYVAAGNSVTYVVRATAPSTPTTGLVTIAVPSGATTFTQTENLAGTEDIYFTANTGTNRCRYI